MPSYTDISSIFWVNHEQAHLVGGGFVQQAQDHGIDPHRFAGAGGASHQYMRHTCEIDDHGHADDVFAQTHGQQ